MTLTLKKTLVLALAASLLTACGGGGGNSSSSTPTTKGLTFAHPIGKSVWNTDGTLEGTVQLSNPTTTSEGALMHSGNRMFSQSLKHKTFFAGVAYDGDDGIGNAKKRTALWSSQGTPETTRLFQDLASESTTEISFAEKNLKVFYAGNDYLYFLTGYSNQLWISSIKDNSARKIIASANGQLSRPYVYGNDAYVFDDEDGKLYRYRPTDASSGTKTNISIHYSAAISSLRDSIEFNGSIYFLGTGNNQAYILTLDGTNTNIYAQFPSTDSAYRLAVIGNNLVANIGSRMYDITTPDDELFGQAKSGDYYIPNHYDIAGSTPAFFYLDNPTNHTSAKIYYKNSLTQEDDVLLVSNTTNAYATLVKDTIYVQGTGKIWAINLSKPDPALQISCSSALTDIVGTLGDYTFIFNNSTDTLYKTRGVVIDEFDVASITCEQVYPAPNN